MKVPQNTQAEVYHSAHLPCQIHRGYEVVTVVDCKALAEVTVHDAFASKKSFDFYVGYRAGCHLGMMITMLFQSTVTALVLKTSVIQR